MQGLRVEQAVLEELMWCVSCNLQFFHLQHTHNEQFALGYLRLCLSDLLVCL